jgi:hypothetical protein
MVDRTVARVSSTRQSEAVSSAEAQLSVLAGSEVRISEEPGSVLIEVEVTDSLRRAWPRLLAVLDIGDTFGLRSSADGQVAWLRLTLEGSDIHGERPEPQPTPPPEHGRDQ